MLWWAKPTIVGQLAVARRWAQVQTWSFSVAVARRWAQVQTWSFSVAAWMLEGSQAMPGVVLS